ncbi:hypothetical protein ACE6H2_015707 [Prunus campanulata]
MGKQITRLAVIDHENGLVFLYFSFAVAFLDPFSLLGFQSLVFIFYKFRLLMAIHGFDSFTWYTWCSEMQQQKNKERSYNFKFDCNLICFIICILLLGCNFKFNIGLFYYFCQRIVVVSIWELGNCDV